MRVQFGQFSEFGCLLGSLYKGAVLYWGPRKGPLFRELPTCKLQVSCRMWNCRRFSNIYIYIYIYIYS